MTIKRIKETCLYINDLERSTEFYNGIMELEIYSKVKGSHVFFKAGDSMLLCFLKGATEKQTNLPPHFANGQIHYAFEVDTKDYESWKEKLISAGIPVEHEQSWKNDLKSFYFRDPDEHLVEILQPGIWD